MGKIRETGGIMSSINQERGKRSAASTIKYIGATVHKTVENALIDVEKTIKIKGLSDSDKEYFGAMRDAYKKHLKNE